MSKYMFLTWGALLFPVVAAGVGQASSFLRGRTWLHRRLFGAVLLLLQGPACLRYAFGEEVRFRMHLTDLGQSEGFVRSALEPFDEPGFYITACAAICGIMAFVVPSPKQGVPSGWRTVGALLFSLAVFAGFCVSVQTWVLFGGSSLGDLGLLCVAMAVPQAFAFLRMCWEAGHCLRTGTAPPPRPEGVERSGVRFFGSLACRTSTALYWGVLSLWLLMLILRSGVAWVRGPVVEFSFLVLPLALVLVAWCVWSSVREIRAPRLDFSGEKPASF